MFFPSRSQFSEHSSNNIFASLVDSFSDRLLCIEADLKQVASKMTSLQAQSASHDDVAFILRNCSATIIEASDLLKVRMENTAAEMSRLHMEKFDVWESAILERVLSLEAKHGLVSELFEKVRGLEELTCDRSLRDLPDYNAGHGLDFDSLRVRVQIIEESVSSMQEFQACALETVFQTYTEDSQTPDFDAPGPSLSAIPCRHFVRGKCYYGNRCKFAHVHNMKETSPDINESDIQFWELMEQAFATCPKRHWCAFDCPQDPFA
jgi:hypothetical protein